MQWFKAQWFAANWFANQWLAAVKEVAQEEERKAGHTRMKARRRITRIRPVDDTPALQDEEDLILLGAL